MRSFFYNQLPIINFKHITYPQSSDPPSHTYVHLLRLSSPNHQLKPRTFLLVLMFSDYLFYESVPSNKNVVLWRYYVSDIKELYTQVNTLLCINQSFLTSLYHIDKNAISVQTKVICSCWI